MHEDLFTIEHSGKINILPEIHPYADLAYINPRELLKKFKENQKKDFLDFISSGHFRPEDLQPPEVSRLMKFPGKEKFRDLFLEIHEHVMEHPVWVHPFFIRFSEGDFDAGQLTRFAVQYYNQIKNTRQCVALALGRFHSMNQRNHGQASERISEMTQIVLSQLLADEYGVGTSPVEEYPTMQGIFQSSTHMTYYRWLFEALDLPPEKHDEPLLHGVADNVYIQRIVAGNPEFSELESLASVGAGMEWGVPFFFSLLLKGLILYAHKNQAPLSSRNVFVLTSHIKYDVFHALSVMFATAFHIFSDDDLKKVKQATSALMAGRYEMMNSIYKYVFGSDLAPFSDHPDASLYSAGDDRIIRALTEARRNTPDGTVMDTQIYRNRKDHPFFISGQF